MIEYRILLNLYDKNYSRALDLAERSNSEDYDFPGKKYIYMARLNSALNNLEKSSKFYESARLIINKTLIKNPDNYNMHSLLAQAYAGLGNKKMAIQEAETAIQIAHKKNRVDEIEMRLYLAQIYTISGDYENAFPLVIYLLNNPSYFTKKLLELDPVWKPLLDQPEYRKKIK
jgi:tetratricopeptide (TPR) repeat protein